MNRAKLTWVLISLSLFTCNPIVHVLYGMDYAIFPKRHVLRLLAFIKKYRLRGKCFSILLYVPFGNSLPPKHIKQIKQLTLYWHSESKAYKCNKNVDTNGENRNTLWRTATILFLVLSRVTKILGISQYGVWKYRDMCVPCARRTDWGGLLSYFFFNYFDL
jgi:hypothetical protein